MRILNQTLGYLFMLLGWQNKKIPLLFGEGLFFYSKSIIGSRANASAGAMFIPSKIE